MNLGEDLNKAIGEDNAEEVRQIIQMANDDLRPVFTGDMSHKQKLIYAYQCLKISHDLLEAFIPAEIMMQFHVGCLAELTKKS